MNAEFLGHTATYWLELQQRVQKEVKFDFGRLLEEICALNGKVNFYESRIKEMSAVMNKQGS